ncbi:MAG: SET domain-containing protein-lysine N-methyltransferase [Gallionellaceae bacterium]|jgi:SET domain-containing protein
MSFSIIEEIGGNGLQVVRPFASGEKVIELSGKWVSSPTKYTIQLGPDKHLEPTDHQWAMINHSCAPNLRVDCEASVMIAIRDIAPGETLSFNYLSTEWDMATPFSCACQAKNCYQTISGAKYLKSEQRQLIQAWPFKA